MEQKILSFKDDKIHSEVELFEYPSEYTISEYLRSNGTQHITLPFYPNQDTRVDIRAKMYPASGPNVAYFGSLYAVGDRQFVLWKLNNQVQFNYSKSSYPRPINPYQVLKISCNKNKMFINGELQAEAPYVNFTSPYPMRIFDVNPLSTNPKSHMDLYYMKIWDNDILIYNLIPVVRDDMVAGLYCLLNRIFLPTEVGENFGYSINGSKLSISDRYILTEELIEYPEELRGGRNYAIGFGEERVVSTGYSGNFGVIPVKPNDYVTVSFYVKGSDSFSGNLFLHQFHSVENPVGSGNRVAYQWLIATIGTEYTYHEETIKIPNNPSIVSYTLGQRTPAGIRVTVRKVKLEKGNKATDWTSAPEDLGLTYPDHIQSFGTSFSNNILTNEFIEQ